jgi:hypothetical protein
VKTEMKRQMINMAGNDGHAWGGALWLLYLYVAGDMAGAAKCLVNSARDIYLHV